MKVLVDRDRCEGHGMCEQSAPQIFQLDDDGEVTILREGVEGELAAVAELGARMCPVAAISLTH